MFLKNQVWSFLVFARIRFFQVSVLLLPRLVSQRDSLLLIFFVNCSRAFHLSCSHSSKAVRCLIQTMGSRAHKKLFRPFVGEEEREGTCVGAAPRALRTLFSRRCLRSTSVRILAMRLFASGLWRASLVSGHAVTRWQSSSQAKPKMAALSRNICIRSTRTSAACSAAAT